MIPADIKLPNPIATDELVIARRGSCIWRVTLADGRVLALKYATENPETQGIQAQADVLAAREEAVLRHIDHSGYLYAAGKTDTGTWLAVAWSDAPNLLDRWKPVRTSDDPAVRAPVQDATRRAAAALATLHASGWRHCDLQAAHILIPDDGPARLIDFALAQGPVELTPEVTHRGALAHLTAPEIASEILETPTTHHIVVTPEAEIYTFGAVLFATWTKQWPTDYGTTNPASLDLEEIHTKICDPAARRQVPRGWPAMTELVESMLDHEPDNRPTADQIRAALTDDHERQA